MKTSYICILIYKILILLYWKNNKIQMGQQNQCCQLPFKSTQIDLNQIKIHWPQVADQIKKLRQTNNSINLLTENNEHLNKTTKNSQKLYKQFITSQNCFFGYVSLVSQTNNNESSMTSNFNLTSSKKNFIKRKSSVKSTLKKQKQNNILSSILPQTFTLRDYAIIISRDKSCFKGYFKNNKFHGRGFQSILQTQQKFEGIYQNGKKKSGAYQCPQFKYIGQFKNGQISEKGRLEFKKTGQIYQGQIKNRKMHGNGKIIYANGDSYEGTLENGLYNGEGIYVWATGQIFKGTYKKGKKHGFGILTMQGKHYELCWVNDKIQGKPLNYQQYATKKQIQISKTKKQINDIRREGKFQDDHQFDQELSIQLNHGAKTSVLIR